MVDMGYRFRIYEPQAASADRTHVRLHAMGVEPFPQQASGRIRGDRQKLARVQADEGPAQAEGCEPVLREVDSVSLQAVIQHLDRAYDNFYRRVASKKKGGYKGTTGYPRFKASTTGTSHTRPKTSATPCTWRTTSTCACQTRHGQNQGQPSRDRRGQIRDRQP